MLNTLLDFIITFLSIVWEALPFVVLGATIAGILEELSPRQAFAFMMSVSAFLLITIFLPREAFEQLGVLPSPAPTSGTDTPFLTFKVGLALAVAGVVLSLLLRLRKSIDRMLALLGRHRLAAIAMSALMGLIMPMCECGIVPVVRRLLRKGMPLSCCTGYMLAGPVINIVVLLSTYMAFAGMENATIEGRPAYQLGGLGMAGLRAGMAWIVAMVTSLVVEWQYRRYGDSLLTPLARSSVKQAENPAEADDDLDDVENKPWRERLANISETALHDFVDILMFLILGALLAAVARSNIRNEDVETFSRHYPVLAIGAMMGLAVVLCLCSEADAFVAASFTALRPSSKLAFLVLGPMLDFKLYMMFLRVYRPRLIWTIIPCVVLQVLVYSLIFHVIWETYAPVWWGPQ